MNNLLRFVKEMVIGHQHVESRAFSIKNETYVRCLECAMKRQYSWASMKAYGPWYTEIPVHSERVRTQVSLLNEHPTEGTNDEERTDYFKKLNWRRAVDKPRGS